MVDIEHPAYGLIKAFGLHYGYSPEDGDSWATIVGDPYAVWEPIKSDEEALGLTQLLTELGLSAKEAIDSDPGRLLMLLASVMTRHAVRVAEYTEGKKETDDDQEDS